MGKILQLAPKRNRPKMRQKNTHKRLIQANRVELVADDFVMLLEMLAKLRQNGPSIRVDDSLERGLVPEPGLAALFRLFDHAFDLRNRFFLQVFDVVEVQVRVDPVDLGVLEPGLELGQRRQVHVEEPLVRLLAALLGHFQVHSVALLVSLGLVPVLIQDLLPHGAAIFLWCAHPLLGLALIGLDFESEVAQVGRQHFRVDAESLEPAQRSVLEGRPVVVELGLSAGYRLDRGDVRVLGLGFPGVFPQNQLLDRAFEEVALFDEELRRLRLLDYELADRPLQKGHFRVQFPKVEELESAAPDVFEENRVRADRQSQAEAAQAAVLDLQIPPQGVSDAGPAVLRLESDLDLVALAPRLSQPRSRRGIACFGGRAPARRTCHLTSLKEQKMLCWSSRVSGSTTLEVRRAEELERAVLQELELADESALGLVADAVGSREPVV